MRRSQVEYRQNGGHRKDVPASANRRIRKNGPKGFPAGTLPKPSATAYNTDAVVAQMAMNGFTGVANFSVYTFKQVSTTGELHPRCQASRILNADGTLMDFAPDVWSETIADAHAAWVAAGKPATFEIEIPKGNTR
jgi:hypothetical protein